MHAKLDLKFVFDEATIPGETREEKEAYIQRRLTSIAEHAADTTASNEVVVDEVTHEITLTR